MLQKSQKTKKRGKTVEERLSDYGLFFNSHPGALARNRRQLASAIGIGVGVLALYDVESLKSTVSEMESRHFSATNVWLGK